MKTDHKKQFIILIICAIGLYFSGKNLIAIDSISSLLDALNAMTFFTCFFPFVITGLALISKSLKYLINFSAH
ncbi:hypothetical protein BW723_10655 [Polaribacter reichenbachii]|uniref:Uncharacterized protein n=1 Tax=Polaribacter reichenbachii TaxID=996801 RepID=A0A1B8TQ75_9FLAO|nr:hypothetical protein [Polaribacter reichenbachii]APZ46716.1 hypothetical protein BW723_10655 [Polaribacter reichenbachii]AUC17359.1 hypothetical protein BTO17_01100 [Polaribacter reichenbachii]OBY61765.1 hypothetical protein LPB301_17100 [Polaribacter reichenbachii]